MRKGGESEAQMRAGTRSRGFERRITGAITGPCTITGSANSSGRLQGRAENANPGEGRGAPMCQAAHLKMAGSSSGSQVAR